MVGHSLDQEVVWVACDFGCLQGGGGVRLFETCARVEREGGEKEEFMEDSAWQPG